MAEIIFPSQLKHARSKFRYIDSTGAVRGAYTGAVQTTAYGGDRIGATIDMRPVGGLQGQADRAALIAWLATLKGKQNRAWIWDQSYTQRGSFPSAELLTNNTFQNGTFGWTGSSEITGSVSERIYRATRNAVSGNSLLLKQTPTTVTPYASYVNRAFLKQGRGNFSTGFDVSPGSLVSSSLGSYGMLTRAYVPLSGSDDFRVQDLTTNGLLPGDYVEISFTSLSRCPLVDNSPNALLHSDDFTTTWINQDSNDSANTATAPDGTSSADSLIEGSGASQTHYIAQFATKSAVTQDWTGVVYAKSSTRTQVGLQIGESSVNFARVIVDLSTGNVAAGPSVGGTVTNARVNIRDAGNGWWYIALTASVASTITATNLFAVMVATGNTVSYSGDGVSKLFVWRGAYAASSFPFLPGVTTTTALPSGTPQSGSGINVKGLPASASGLLLTSDWVQSGSQPLPVASPLNSDAAGLGFLQFSPPVRISPADNDPIIVNQPMGKFIFSGTFPEWDNVPGIFTTASVDLEESCD